MPHTCAATRAAASRSACTTPSTESAPARRRRPLARNRGGSGNGSGWVLDMARSDSAEQASISAAFPRTKVPPWPVGRPCPQAESLARGCRSGLELPLEDEARRARAPRGTGSSASWPRSRAQFGRITPPAPSARRPRRRPRDAHWRRRSAATHFVVAGDPARDLVAARLDARLTPYSCSKPVRDDFRTAAGRPRRAAHRARGGPEDLDRAFLAELRQPGLRAASSSGSATSTERNISGAKNGAR